MRNTPQNTHQNAPETLGERLRFSRDVAKLSRRELAEMTGMSARTIEHYENGTTDATYQKLCQLSEALCVEITWLVSGGLANEGDSDFESPREEESIDDNNRPSETPSGTAQLEKSLGILVELREAGLEKHQRRATAIIQEIHGSAKYVEPQELASFTFQREIFIVKDYSPETTSVLIHSAADRDSVEAFCAEIVDRLIDQSFLGFDLFKVKLTNLVELAEKWGVEPNRILAFAWRGHEEIIPALRPRLRRQALHGKATGLGSPR